ncbi:MULTISPECIES: EF-hand domain-containing protein [Rhodomicrobium]|uniref:EF-hand domain-containing protein n=1 Tax=Rhodomicrobium TaxID=1068 RepID=UPI000B4BACC1|nr:MULTISPECIES: EF-hand domain-containing protein [Rhodomicrobium]
MRITTARLIACLAATGLMAGCAGSSGPKISAVDKSFLGGIGSYDQNHDGAVTCDEWRVAAANLFTKANKSGSGALTEAEYGNLISIDRTFQVATFKYYDVNGDGKIDKKEFVDRPNPAFNYADKDKDCRLTDLELLTANSLSAPPPQSQSAHARVTGAPSGTSAAPGGSRY